MCIKPGHWSFRSGLYLFQGFLSCPLETPEEAVPAAAVGPFSTEGVVPGLLQNMGCRNTEGRLIEIPLAVVFGRMRFIPSAQLAVHYPLFILLVDSITQRCIRTGSGGRNFGSTPLSPSIILVTPTSSRTITMSVFMTMTTRTVSFTNQLGTRFFGFCDPCFTAWTRTFIRGVVRGITIETNNSKSICLVTLVNSPFIRQI